MDFSYDPLVATFVNGFKEAISAEVGVLNRINSTKAASLDRKIGGICDKINNFTHGASSDVKIPID